MKATEKPVPAPETDYVLKLVDRYRARLGAVVESAESDRMAGVVDVLDSSFHLKERLTFAELDALGWNVHRKEYGVELVNRKRPNKTVLVTDWPVDPFGVVADRTRKDPRMRAPE